MRDVARRAHPQLHSIIRRFALYAASLRLAIEANVLPWTVAEADAGLIAVLERWVKYRGNSAPVTMQSRVADFVRSLADDLSDRFIHVCKVKGRFIPATQSDEAKLVKQQEYDGFVQDDLVLIRPEAWVRRCTGADHEKIARHFYGSGDLLTRNDGKFSKSISILGTSARLYALRRTVLSVRDTHDTNDTEK